MADSELPDQFAQTIELAMRAKRAMIEKDKRRGWTKCPRCGGKITAVLAGRKNHLHMACETEGCIRMME